MVVSSVVPRLMFCSSSTSLAKRIASVFVCSWGCSSLGSEVDVASLSLDELLAVEVTTPGKVPEAIRDTPASVYLVNREDIETYGYANLAEVLENVPGFYNIESYNGADGNFGIRGFWNGRRQNSSVAILVNGVQQSRPDIYSNPLETLNIPVEAIDRVEVSRGPNSVIYGNGAAFGAINIITNASYTNDQLSVSYGTNDTQRIGLRLSEFGEDYHLIVNAGSFTTNGFDYDFSELATEDRLELLPNMGVTPDNATLEDRLEQKADYVQISGAWRDFSLEFSRNEASVEWFTGFPAVVEGSVRESTTNRLKLGLEVPLSSSFSLDTRIVYSDYDGEQTFDALFPGFVGTNTRSFQNWELESLLIFAPDDRFRLLTGVNLQRLENFKEFTDVPDLGLVNETIFRSNQDSRSIFAQASYLLTDKLHLVGGYRVERIPEFVRTGFIDEPLDGPPSFVKPVAALRNATPRASIIFQPDDSQVLKLMVGDAVKLPNLRNAIAQPERIRTTEFNYTWTSESVLFSGSVFRNVLTDLRIEELAILPGNLIEFITRAGGRVQTEGVELLFQGQLDDHWSGEFGVTWQDSMDLSQPDGLLSYSPEIVANAKLAYRVRDMRLSANMRYVGSMRSFFNANETPNPLVDGFFGEPSSSFVSFDLNARLENVFKNGYISMHLTNVFDTEIRYPNNPINGLLLNRGNLGYGRRLALKAGLRF